MKKKGFTLIELLAVIVILAVIAVIATPIIMNAINEAKKGAAKDSAYSYMDSIEYYIALTLNDDDLNNDFPVNGSLTATQAQILLSNVQVKGSKPTALGDVVIENGKGISAKMTINEFDVAISGGEVTEVK